MNYEKEMQASLRVIFQNIQALEKSKKDTTTTTFHGRIVSFKMQHPNLNSLSENLPHLSKENGICQGRLCLRSHHSSILKL